MAAEILALDSFGESDSDNFSEELPIVIQMLAVMGLLRLC